MKILGINCSPRKGKTTFYALEQCLEVARKEQAGLETEIIELGKMDIQWLLCLRALQGKASMQY